MSSNITREEFLRRTAAAGGTCADDPPTDLQKVAFYTDRYPGITRDHIMEQVREGKLCAYKFGGRWMIGEADFKAFINVGRNV